MSPKSPLSILFPWQEEVEYRPLPETAWHDLGLDVLTEKIAAQPQEVPLIRRVMTSLTPDPRVSAFRADVFEDLLAHPEIRNRLMKLLEQVKTFYDYGVTVRPNDRDDSLWDLLHRLEEYHDYIITVEEIRECLSDASLSSRGLVQLKETVDGIYAENGFAALKKDVEEMRVSASQVKSLTLGVNLNDRFEAVSMGLVSVNSKPFRKSNIVSSFADAVASKNRIHDDCEWNGDMHYHQIEKAGSGFISNIQTMGAFTAVTSNAFVDGAVRSTVVNSPEGDNTTNSTWYLDNIMNKILDSLVKKLRDVLTKYSNIAVVNISGIMPEFVYYIRFAEFIEKKMKCGFRFCEPKISENETVSMKAKDLYNLRLALTMEKPDDIVYNDLDFDKEHSIYILTGANRGGKTTITQAVGLMFVLAQGGIYVPASEFIFKPADCIYTHFPADEDKTLDLGRLGEECVRFKDIYSECTENSLVLLNETFSTTSFEEGYYIARDSVRALLKKQVRAIYNTHMHKLAESVDEMNAESTGVKASSLIMKNENGKRSFKVERAAPEGSSYAKDIAEKYGVTYEMLTEGN